MLDDLLAGCAILDGEGLTTAFGHLSARRDDGTVVVTGNAGPGLVRSQADLLVVDAEGRLHDGDPAVVPGELAIHLGILAARPDVAAVCRFHGPACLAYSTRGRPLRAAIGIGLFLGAGVPWFDTDTTVTTPAQGAALAACLGDGNAVLLRGFGAVTVGQTIAEAVVRAWLLERSAAAVLAAGDPLPYATAAAAPFARGEGPAAGQLRRLWTYLRRRRPAPVREEALPA